MSVIKNDQLFSQQSLLSNHSGNLLQVRDDGLYYGMKQEPRYESLYVDAQRGNDDNPGTREQPLRTLTKALTLPTRPGDRHIYLYHGQRHQVRASEYIYTPGGKVTIFIYGPNLVTNVGYPSGAVENYNLNTIIDFYPMIVQADIYAKKKYAVTNIISVREEATFHFIGLQIHMHEHSDWLKYEKTIDGWTWLFHSHSGLFGTYHSPRVNTILENSSVHFHYSQEAIRRGLVGCFLKGKTAFHGNESHSMISPRGVFGDGARYFDTIEQGLTLQLDVNRETFRKYFNNIRIDKYGNTNCTLNPEIKPFIEGW